MAVTSITQEKLKLHTWCAEVEVEAYDKHNIARLSEQNLKHLYIYSNKIIKMNAFVYHGIVKLHLFYISLLVFISWQVPHCYK